MAFVIELRNPPITTELLNVSKDIVIVQGVSILYSKYPDPGVYTN